MLITLQLHGNLKRYARAPQGLLTVHAAEGATVQSILELIGVPPQDWWMVAINDLVVEENAALKAGDRVEIFEPVAGG